MFCDVLNDLQSNIVENLKEKNQEICRNNIIHCINEIEGLRKHTNKLLNDVSDYYKCKIDSIESDFKI